VNDQVCAGFTCYAELTFDCTYERKLAVEKRANDPTTFRRQDHVSPHDRPKNPEFPSNDHIVPSSSSPRRKRSLPSTNESIETIDITIMLSSRAILRATRAAPAQRAAVSQLRSYATSSADPKPPVALYGLDGTYASALVCLVLVAEAVDGGRGGDG
jgi:hypothetical protein